jgi:uridine phosphorylase
MTPAALLAYRRATGALPDFQPPHTVIFAPQKSLAEYVLRRHPVKKIRGFLGEFYLLQRTRGRIALSTNFGIGAPVIAGLADEFAALGAKQFVLLGMAGGLQPEMQTGSLVIATQALRGEGVSRHYIPTGATVDASAEMVAGVSQLLEARARPFTRGPIWTTDAPFRELRHVVLEYQSAGILAVDMEAAALFAVAQSMGLAALAAFSIADQLAGGYLHMSTDMRPAQKGLHLLFDTALEYLLSKPAG